MKKYILTLSVVLGMTCFAQAQSNKVPTATEIATKNIQAMEKKVKINATQKSIIYNYSLDVAKEQVALYKKQQAGQYSEEDLPKFYKLQNQTNNSIRNILKGEQLAQYDEFLEEQLRGVSKKKKKGKANKDEEEEVVTGISGLILPTSTKTSNK